MSRTFVCVETAEFFTRAMERVATQEGDRLLFVSNAQEPPEGIAAARLNVRDDPGEVAAAIRARCRDAPVAAVSTTQEMFITATAAVADTLGVARNSVQAVGTARDKARMKEAWRAAGVNTPGGSYFRSRTGLDVTQVDYPAIVKPTLGYASCGVRRVNCEAELLEQLRKIAAINATLVAKEGIPGAGFLIEECLEGPEYSVDTLWFDGEPICDGLMSRGCEDRSAGPYYPDRLYLLDQSLPEDRRQAILDLAYRAVRALGIGFGPTHTEVRFHGEIPYVLETATRPGANGIFYGLLEQAYGTDFIRVMYLTQVCRDRKEFNRRLGTVTARPVPSDTNYFWYHLPHKGSGIIKDIIGLDELSSRPDVLLCVCYKRPGNHLYAESDFNSEYFCSIVGRYVRKPGDPPVETHVKTYDDTLKVVF